MELFWKWVFQTGRQCIYSHVKRFVASGYISDSNRKAEVLITNADNGKHIEISIKLSRADSHDKMWSFAEVSETDVISIFRAFLVVRYYQTISKSARTHWWRFLPYKGIGNNYSLCYSALLTWILRNCTVLKSCQYVSVSQ
jgi:hypothetical protein